MDFIFSKYPDLKPIALLINNFFFGILQKFFYFSGAIILRNECEWLLPHIFGAIGNTPKLKPCLNYLYLHHILKIYSTINKCDIKAKGY